MKRMPKRKDSSLGPESDDDEWPQGDVVLRFSKQQSLRTHSQVLSLCSPVFKSMLEGAFVEGQTREIQIEDFRREDFVAFYRFLLPQSLFMQKRAKVEVGSSNVDVLLRLSDFYQVKQLRNVCVEYLERLPAEALNEERLNQAKTYNLTTVYSRCLDNLSKNFDTVRVDKLHPNVMQDLMYATQKRYKTLSALRPELEIARDLASEHIGKTKKDDEGQNVSIRVATILGKTLQALESQAA
jgi:hypothetical protein